MPSHVAVAFVYGRVIRDSRPVINHMTRVSTTQADIHGTVQLHDNLSAWQQTRRQNLDTAIYLYTQVSLIDRYAEHRGLLS